MVALVLPDDWKRDGHVPVDNFKVAWGDNWGKVKQALVGQM